MNTPKSNTFVNKLSTPTTPSTPKNTSSDTGIVQRLDIILKQIISWHDKWQAAQKRGHSLVCSIEAIKARAISQKEKDLKADLYPIEQLQPHCSNLTVILTIFEDAVMNLRLFRKQLVALCKLEVESRIPYKTWSMLQFLDFTERVLKAYEQEFNIKTIVKENIAHSTTKSELAWHNAIWQYPTYVNQDIEFLFQCIKIETT